jgi:AraC-like DNA-binding protein
LGRSLSVRPAGVQPRRTALRPHARQPVLAVSRPYFAQPALDALLPTLGLTRLPGFSSNAVADARLIHAFGRAHRELDRGDPALAREQLIEACGLLFSTYAADRPARRDLRGDRTHVDAALTLIRARFRERITVDEIATAVGLSPFQLIRQFNRVTGMPPHAHVLRARLHDAVRQMRQGVELRDAAVAAGFYDQSDLTRRFRLAYGITPGQYVRSHFTRLRPGRGAPPR